MAVVPNQQLLPLLCKNGNELYYQYFYRLAEIYRFKTH